MKKILTVVLVLMIMVIAICSKTYMRFVDIYDYLISQKETSFDSYDQNFSENLWNKDKLINLNGFINKTLGVKDYYDTNIYVSDDGCIKSAYNKCDTDYEYYELIEFYDYLKNHGINMLYVNEPTKYINDEDFINEFKKDTYVNRNADLLLSRIKDYGIPCIDLRDNIKEENINVLDLFYKTDHHWTTRAGLWASKHIAEALNEYCYYNIDTSIFDEKNFVMTEYKNAWLGEQGRKIGQSYVGLDDYTVIKPNYETSYVFIEDEGFIKGTFDYFVNKDIYTSNENVYDVRSWHYSYSCPEYMNNRVDYGKVLFISDSYQNATYPFLSLGINHMNAIILRGKKDDFDLCDYIIKNEFDTVIISYSEMMIGAHEDITNANYKMFTFNK